MAPESPKPELPDRVTMGLLAYLDAHSIDEDYAAAARRRELDPDRPDATPPRIGGIRAAVVLAVFAVLAATAAVQTSRDSGSEEQERQELIAQVTAGRDSVDEQRRVIRSLESETQELEDQLLGSSASSRRILRDVDILSLRSGIGPARGPGVEVIADDAPDATQDRNRVLDVDLQKLVNGLWQAGAEAISINGERLTALSAIRHAGSAITVNFTSLRRPYRILAIGNPDRIPARFAESTTGQAWFDLTAQVGLQFSIEPRESLLLPGADLPRLRFIDTGKAGEQ